MRRSLRRDLGGARSFSTSPRWTRPTRAVCRSSRTSLRSAASWPRVRAGSRSGWISSAGRPARAVSGLADGMDGIASSWRFRDGSVAGAPGPAFDARFPPPSPGMPRALHSDVTRMTVRPRGTGNAAPEVGAHGLVQASCAIPASPGLGASSVHQGPPGRGRDRGGDDARGLPAADRLLPAQDRARAADPAPGRSGGEALRAGGPGLDHAGCRPRLRGARAPFRAHEAARASCSCSSSRTSCCSPSWPENRAALSAWRSSSGSGCSATRWWRSSGRSPPTSTRTNRESGCSRSSAAAAPSARSPAPCSRAGSCRSAPRR